MRRNAFSAEIAADIKQSALVSHSHRRTGLRVDSAGNNDCRIGYGHIEEKQIEACDGGYYGEVESGDISDECEIAEPNSRAFGEVSSFSWYEASPSYVLAYPVPLPHQGI